jgi:hypothetical protein
LGVVDVDLASAPPDAVDRERAPRQLASDVGSQCRGRDAFLRRSRIRDAALKQFKMPADPNRRAKATVNAIDAVAPT